MEDDDEGREPDADDEEKEKNLTEAGKVLF